MLGYEKNDKISCKVNISKLIHLQENYIPNIKNIEIIFVVHIVLVYCLISIMTSYFFIIMVN